MKKDELKFLYIIVFLVALIVIALFIVIVNIKNNEIKEQEQKNSSLQQQLEMISRTKRENPIFKEATNVKSKSEVEMNAPENKKYIGKWKRISMSINGVPENFSKAVLEINEKSFIKTTDCSISGSLSISDSKMIMSVENDGCKEGKNNFINNYAISSDGKSLTLSIDDPQFKMVEGYERVSQE